MDACNHSDIVLYEIVSLNSYGAIAACESIRQALKPKKVTHCNERVDVIMNIDAHLGNPYCVQPQHNQRCHNRSYVYHLCQYLRRDPNVRQRVSSKIGSSNSKQINGEEPPGRINQHPSTMQHQAAGTHMAKSVTAKAMQTPATPPESSAPNLDRASASL